MGEEGALERADEDTSNDRVFSSASALRPGEEAAAAAEEVTVEENMRAFFRLPVAIE